MQSGKTSSRSQSLHERSRPGTPVSLALVRSYTTPSPETRASSVSFRYAMRNDHESLKDRRVIDYFAHKVGPGCSRYAREFDGVKLNHKTLKTIRVWLCHQRGDEYEIHIQRRRGHSITCRILAHSDIAPTKIVVRGVSLGINVRVPFSRPVFDRLDELVIVYEPPSQTGANPFASLAMDLSHYPLSRRNLNLTLVFKTAKPGDRWPMPGGIAGSNRALTTPQPLTSFRQPPPRESVRRDMEALHIHVLGRLIGQVAVLMMIYRTLRVTLVNTEAMARPATMHEFIGTARNLLLEYQAGHHAGRRYQPFSKRFDIVEMADFIVAHGDTAFSTDEQRQWEPFVDRKLNSSALSIVGVNRFWR